MPNVTNLTFTVESSFATLGSIDLYCVYDGEDFRIKPGVLQQVIGRRGGAGMTLTGAYELAHLTQTDIIWDAVMYEDGAWTDFANSPTCFFAPRPMILQAGLSIAVESTGEFPIRTAILKNSSFDTGDSPWSARQYAVSGDERKTTLSKPMVMASGDLITAKVMQSKGVAANLDGAENFFFVYPLMYI